MAREGENLRGLTKGITTTVSPHTLHELISSRQNAPLSSSARSGSATSVPSLEDDLLEALNALPQEEDTGRGDTNVSGEPTRRAMNDCQLPSVAYPDLSCAPREDLPPSRSRSRSSGTRNGDVGNEETMRMRRTQTKYAGDNAEEGMELSHPFDEDADDDDGSSCNTLLRGYDRDDTWQAGKGARDDLISDAAADIYDDDLYGRELLAACAEGAESLAIAEVDVRLASISRQLKSIMARVESGEQAIKQRHLEQVRGEALQPHQWDPTPA